MNSTGLPEEEDEDDYIPEGPLKTQQMKERDNNMEFAEDIFHKKDATSSYIIQQREQAIKDKWAKHEKEKMERIDDPSVEYIDVDDFKPGGKYGPAKKEAGATADVVGGVSNANELGGIADESLIKASNIVKEGVRSMTIGTGGGEKDGESNNNNDANSSSSSSSPVAVIGAQGLGTAGLKSNLWTELLD